MTAGSVPGPQQEPVELRRVRLTDSLVEPLLQGLAEEYGRRYGLSIGAGEMAAAPAQQFEPPDGAFRSSSTTAAPWPGAGCGACRGPPAR